MLLLTVVVKVSWDDFVYFACSSSSISGLLLLPYWARLLISNIATPAGRSPGIGSAWNEAINPEAEPKKTIHISGQLASISICHHLFNLAGFLVPFALLHH